jgi:ABC-type phosphate transport system substrate-binding protein
MRALPIIAAVLGLATLASVPPARTAPAQSAYRLIVHPSNRELAVERRFVEDAFLKKIKSWPSGEVIRPVDLAPHAAVRRSFTEEVLKRSPTAVRAYWQKLIFSGRDVPPPELDTDDAVVSYVKRYPGAIGYVSAGASLSGAKVVAIDAE